MGATPVLVSANDKPLPLDPYLLNPAQQTALAETEQRLLAACVARFHLAYTPDPGRPAPRDSDAPTSRTDGRYGRQNAALAARWGYHPEGGLRTGSAWPNGAFDPRLRLVESGAADGSRKFGPGGSVVNGETVPDHGCIGEGTKRLTGSVDGLLGDAQIAVDLKLDTLQQSRQDGRTQAVFARWSACMKKAGFDYPDPVAASGDPAWLQTPLPTPREVRVATADAACRRETNLVGVWYSVDYAYQQRAVEENHSALTAVRAGIEAQMRAVAKASAG